MRRKRVKRFVMYTVQILYQNARAKNGLLKFRSDDSNVKPRSEGSVEIDSDKIKALVDVNRRYATRGAAEIPNVSKSSV